MVLFNFVSTQTLDSYLSYKKDVKLIKNQLGFKIAGFTEKSKFKLLLDSRSPFNEGNVFVPDENYEVFLNKSSVIDLVSYSGVIIEKKPAGFVVRGYDTTNPYFKYFKVRELSDDPVVNVGGISESFVRWFADQSYVEGQIVEFDNEYYTVKVAHRSGVNFEVSNFVKLAELPVSGGRNAFFRRQFD